jgi:hypothetical protein
VIVVAATITYSAAYFSNRTQLVYFDVATPVVRESDPWAGQHIGIQFLSTVSPELAGGYWDLDDVRLSSTLAPAFSSPAMINGQFQFTLLGEPGAEFELLTATNPALPISNWLSLGYLINETGTTPFVDTNADLGQRFYQVRQLP